MNWKKFVSKTPPAIKTPRFGWHGQGQPSKWWKPTQSTTLASLTPQYDAEVL